MAIKKRLVHVGKNATSLATLKKTTAAENPYLHSISFYAGNDATADILTHGESYVQAPIDAREVALVGNSGAAGDYASIKVSLVDANAELTGLTLTNLNTAISQLNTYIGNVDTNVTKASEVTLTKLTTADTGFAATYQLYQGYENDGTTRTAVGDKINIPKDQFLKNASFVSSAVQADKEIQTDVVVGDPYLKFEWQLDADGDSETNNVITYVAVKELVDIYVGGTVKSAASTTTKVNESTQSGTTVTAVADSSQAIAADRYQTTVSLTTAASGANGAGKEIKVTLNDNILADLAAGGAALDNAKVYADNKQKETQYALVGKGVEVFTGLAAVTGDADAGTWARTETTKKALGGTDVPTVADAINKVGTAILANTATIAELKNQGAATSALIDSLTVQTKGFPSEKDADGKRNITLYAEELTLSEKALTNEDNTVEANTVEDAPYRAAADFSWTNATDITSALLDLASAWEWAEISTDGSTITYVI